MKQLAKNIFIVFVFSCFGLLPQNNQAAESNLKAVPLFTLTDHHGNQVSLVDYRGKVVMINFWATWCAPCIEEMPTMQALRKSMSGQPFEILAVNMGEEEDAVKAFVNRINIEFSFPLLIDPSTSVANAYQVSGLPATLLVNKLGEFEFGGVGARDWNSDESRQMILALLEK